MCSASACPDCIVRLGRSTVIVIKVPDDAEQRLPAVMAAAEAILEAATLPVPG